MLSRTSSLHWSANWTSAFRRKLTASLRTSQPKIVRIVVSSDLHTDIIHSPLAASSVHSSKRQRVSRAAEDVPDPEFDLEVALMRLRLLFKHLNVLRYAATLDTLASPLNTQLNDCLQSRTEAKICHTNPLIVSLIHSCREAQGPHPLTPHRLWKV